MSSKINLQTCEYARKSSIFQDNQLIFYKCSKLTDLDISSFVTSYGTNMESMFSYCDELTSPVCSDYRILAAYNDR